MVVVVFRSRIRDEHVDEYSALADRMFEIASTMPGFISVKDFVAEDGERVSVHEWESAEALAAWRDHPEHVRAQELGRKKLLAEYTLSVFEDPRESRFGGNVGA